MQLTNTIMRIAQKETIKFIKERMEFIADLDIVSRVPDNITITVDKRIHL